MLLITSGALVSEELRAEFGPVPPVMLPLGNRALIQHQIEAAAMRFPGERIVVSLPVSYCLPSAQRALLARNQVVVVRVKDGLRLGQSIRDALEASGCGPDEPLRLLHGDTLVLDMPKALDVVAVSTTRSGYNWKVESDASDTPVVWCGFFSFSRAADLVEQLTTADCDFVAAVSAYQHSRNVTLFPVSEWFDLGHINTYFDSRERYTTARAFNSLQIRKHQAWKSSSNSAKILAEAAWYANLPPDLKRYAPQLVEVNRAASPPYYRTEYLRQVSLSELFVFGANARPFWANILELCEEYFGVCVETYANVAPASRQSLDSRIAGMSYDMLATKTWQRLDSFTRSRQIKMDCPLRLNGKDVGSLQQVAGHCIELATANVPLPAHVHGDFCFSNILYDARANALKVIDPRGVAVDGTETCVGDLGYDIAKLLHSAVGCYDVVLAGHFDLQSEGPTDLWFQLYTDVQKQEVGALFADATFAACGRKAQRYIPAMILLFLSMLPLHADDARRQAALLANALRLYEQWVR